MAPKRRTRAEWLEIVSRWKSSGVDAAVFAARNRIKVSTLRWWGSELRDEVRPGALVREIVVDAAPVASHSRFTVALGGLELRFEVGTDPAYVADVAAALIAAARA